MENNVAGSIRGFVQKRFPIVLEQKLSDDDSLLESGAIDSLGILDVVTFLEEKFGIQIEDEELDPEYFENLSSLTRLVNKKLG